MKHIYLKDITYLFQTSKINVFLIILSRFPTIYSL